MSSTDKTTPREWRESYEHVAGDLDAEAAQRVADALGAQAADHV